MTPVITSELYSVVVAGAMNPAIHHPQWYLAIDQLSEDEVKAALHTGNFIFVPQLARFQTAGMELQCLPDKWQLSTPARALLPRLVQLSSSTFQRLGETPIRSYGVNTRVELQVDEELGTRLSESLGDIPLGLRFRERLPNLTSLVVEYPLEDLVMDGQPTIPRTFKATLQHRAGALLININVDHQIPLTATPVRFDLDHLLERSTEAQSVSDAFVAQISSTIAEGTD